MKRVRTGLLVLLAGCASATGPDSPADVALSLDLSAETFTRDPRTGSAATPFILENRGGATVLVPRCGDEVSVEVERQQGGRWTQYASGRCLANVVMTPVALPSGASVRGVWRAGEAGRFRLRVVAGCDCNLRIGYAAQSDAFEVR